jgi:hypothetical protein
MQGAGRETRLLAASFRDILLNEKGKYRFAMWRELAMTVQLQSYDGGVGVAA